MGTPNSDEAIVGLMVRHIINHGQIGTFYWGQAYGGFQEALLTVPVFLIGGSTWFGLRLVPIGLSAVASLLIWRVGRRTIGEPAARVAGAVFWLWPSFNLYTLTHQYDFYASNVVYCALLLLLALRILERPDRARIGLFGLVLGLAFWQTAQIVPVAIPIIAWTIWKKPACVRYAWIAALLALLGSLPWILWNAGHSWKSLDQPPYGDYVHSLRLLASPSIPMMIGLRTPYSARLLLPPAALTYLVYLCLIGLFVVGAYRFRRGQTSLVYFVAAVFPFIYAASPKTVLALGIPRYITVLTPILALLLAQLATTYARAVVVVAVVFAVSVVTVARMNDWFRGVPARTTNAKGLGPRHATQWVPRNLSGLISTLKSLGLDHVYADYWLAYRLDFDSDEHIVAVENRFTHVTFDRGQAIPSPVPDGVRAPSLDREVRQARHGFVFYGQIIDSVPIVKTLEHHGYRRHRSGTFVIYAPA
jgi:hypothetical protein